MKKLSQDYAKSSDQLRWSYAVSQYERMKEWSTKSGTALQDFATKRMEELESKYPQLAK